MRATARLRQDEGPVMYQEETSRRHASIHELLVEVFKVAATAGRQRSVLLAHMMGLTRGGGEFTGLELAVEAVNLRGMALRAAGFMGSRALTAIYEYPVDDPTRRAEDTAVERCAFYCMSENSRLRDKFFVQDAVRDFCDKRMHHDYDWWSKHCDRTIRTLHTWSKSKVPADRSVHGTMTRLTVPAIARVEAMLYERGIHWEIA